MGLPLLHYLTSAISLLNVTATCSHARIPALNTADTHQPRLRWRGCPYDGPRLRRAKRRPPGGRAKRGPAGLQRGSPAGRKGGGDLLSRARGAVPSARAGLTALFGMGRGGAPPLWPPGRAGDARARVDDDGRHRGRGAALSGRGGGSAPRRRGKPLGPLVPVGSGLAAAAPPAYPRGRLPRPSGEASSRGGLRA